MISIKIKSVIVLLCLFQVSEVLTGQANPDSKDIIFYQIMNARGTRDSDAFTGSEYLEDEWYPAVLTLKNGTKANLNNAKINLRTSNVDALFLGDEKELLSQHFDMIELNVKGISRKFYSNTAKNVKGMNESGFYEIAGNGPDFVIVRHSVYIQKPHPQAKILGLESKHKIVKRNSVNILHDEKLYEVQSKKDLKKIYKEKSSTIDKIFEKSTIDFKNPMHIAKFIEELHQQL